MEMDLNASFEDEMLAMNPEYDLIFSKYDEDRLNLSPQFFEPQRQCPPDKMKIISQMNQLTGLKPLGDLATHKDWENTDTTEKETIALMRNMGIEPSIDQPPDESRTISTVPVNDDIIVNRNGNKRMQVFLGNSYFTLQPRSELSYFPEEEEESKQMSSNDTSTSDFTESSYMYQPIQMDDSNETESLEESFEKEKVILNKSTSNNESIRGWRSERPTNNDDGSSRFLRRSTDSDGSSKKNKNWWRSSDNSVEKRDENNWRISASKPVEEIEEKLANVANKESRTTKNSASSTKPVREKQPTIPSQKTKTIRNCKSTSKSLKDQPNVRNADSISKPVEEIEEKLANVANKESRTTKNSASPTKPVREKQPTIPSQEPKTIRNCKSTSKSLKDQPNVRNADSISKPKPFEEITPKVAEISKCGSPLFKPQELFLRKRAQLIKQVLAANQS